MRSRNASALLLSILIMIPPAVGLASSQQTFPVASHLVGVLWTGTSFITSNIAGTTRLLNVSLDGKTVQPFAPSFAGEGEVYIALSPGRAGFRSGDLYLSSNDSIYSLGSRGGSPTLFVRMAGQALEYITFDYTGQWGYDLFALTGDGSVWAVDSSGSVTQVVSLGDNLKPEGLTVAPSGFDSYGGDLLVATENNHQVAAISKATHQIKTLAVFPGEAPERVLTIPGGNWDLYVAKYDQGAIVKFDSGNFSGYAGSILVITEGEKGQTGSLSVLTAAGSNITTTRIFTDPNSPHFEGAAFVPETATEASTGMSGPAGTLSIFQLVAGILIVAVAVGGVALVVRGMKRPGAGSRSTRMDVPG